MQKYKPIVVVGIVQMKGQPIMWSMEKKNVKSFGN